MAAKKRRLPVDTYRPHYAEQVYKLALLGATREQIANFYQVGGSTIDRWRDRHPAFGDAMRRGKDEADSKVAESLYRRATGYSHPEDKIFNDQGRAMVVATVKHYPPDTTACIFWLKNRQREQWRDRTELVTVEDQVSKLSEDDIYAALAELAKDDAIRAALEGAGTSRKH